MRSVEFELAQVERELADLDSRIEKQRMAIKRYQGRHAATAVSEASLRLLELNRAFVEAHWDLIKAKDAATLNRP